MCWFFSKVTLTDNLDKRERDLGVPLLRRLEDEIIQGLADLAANARATRAQESATKLAYAALGVQNTHDENVKRTGENAGQWEDGRVAYVFWP